MSETVREGWAIKASIDGEKVIHGGMFDGVRILTNSWMRPDDVGIEMPDGSIRLLPLEGLTPNTHRSKI